MKTHIITCTGDRPEAFELCKHFVSLWQSAIESWVIVSDGKQPDKPPPWAQYIHREVPAGERREQSLPRNLLLALEKVEAREDDAIFFIEDDDYYGAEYLPFMLERLRLGYEIVGQSRARYYNLRTLQWRVLGNSQHASLAQSAIRGPNARATITRVALSCEESARTDIDLQLWAMAPRRSLSRFLAPSTQHFVGLKGLPGRGGYGMGHLDHPTWAVDTDLGQLRKWLGDDITLYSSLLPPLS